MLRDHNLFAFRPAADRRLTRRSMLGSAAVLAALVGAGVPSMAFAQQAAPAADGTASPTQATESTDGADRGSADIVVTARRRAESSQNVPIAITALGPDTLAARGVNTVSDIQHLVPGLNYVERGNLQTELTIRGVGGDARNPGVDSGVGMYVDGVYVPRTSGYNSDLSDVQQIEVLRGPQGTLFGKNTIGGVINITTKLPTQELHGFGYVSYGNYNALQTQASVSGGLADGLSAKITVATWDRDGYIYNVQTNQRFNNENRRGGRLQLRYNPSSNLDINLSADMTRDRRLGVLNQIGSAAGAAAPYFTGDRFRMDADQRNSDDRDMWGVNLTAQYKFDNDLTLTSITAHRDIDILVYSDIDQTPRDLFHSGPFTDDTSMFSQEFRLVSPSGSAFRYVLGLYYYYQKINSDRDIYQNGVRAIVLDTSATTHSYAAYANADYDLTSQLTATVGLRYNIDNKDGVFNQVRTGLNYALTLDRQDKNLSWTASLVYKPTPSLSGYLTVSRGFKSGGFNLDTAGAVGLTAAALNFNPEKVTNYEVGLKGRLFDNLLRFNLSAFHMPYADKQVSQFVQPPVGTIPIVLVTNAGQARINGVEFDASVRPSSRLTVSGNLSYLDAKYKSFEGAAVVNGALVSYTGNRIERTPRWTYSANAEYRAPVASGFVVANGAVTYTGNVFFQPDNAPVNFGPSYTLLDARLGYEAADGKFGAYLWGKNLTNRDYLTFSRQFAGLQQVVYGQPRTYGIETRLRF